MINNESMLIPHIVVVEVQTNHIGVPGAGGRITRHAPHYYLSARKIARWANNWMTEVTSKGGGVLVRPQCLKPRLAHRSQTTFCCRFKRGSKGKRLFCLSECDVVMPRVPYVARLYIGCVHKCSALPCLLTPHAVPPSLDHHLTERSRRTLHLLSSTRCSCSPTRSQ